ncbi:DNA/RNA non-specific endonuclease [Planococcus sp. APC 3900]|uniref:DNA/RNA non-specific endonuclease n=1 Tax=Planococcus sp. APC 3900 TaxID=3035191 RepID=UPI0025B31365|nr:DNA/RNA non-specific endonuclease [Planococcus sp. APC 3900]MDN3437319.1 DNA/RNA non-specific endonuclease [Planococcus sp. APC 3900]
MAKKMEQIQQEALQRYLAFEEERRLEAQAAASRERMMTRSSIINHHDNLAMERIINQSDLFPIAHLQAGLDVSKAVCRISIRSQSGQLESYGTGFLVAPNLLLTNNHVLETSEAAMYAVAEFNYEDDVHFMPRDIISFRLDPEALFITDEALDFTLVAVEENNQHAIPLTNFGYLPLLPKPGKILEGEYVTIIQHPNGGPKAITIRENEVKFISSDFVHYVSDTEPGSSGSPVFNDQWVVVALHHAGIPDPNDPTKWIANEGIRISSIIQHLSEARSSLEEEHSRELLDQLLTVVMPGSAAEPMEVGVLAEDWYADASGYDPTFLGQGFDVPLPALGEALIDDVAQTADGKRVLDYMHFSIAMSKSRRLAFYTAVNIDGNQLVDVKRSNDRWYFDPRIDEAYQIGPEFYQSNDIDRGHLVRRRDPNWGVDAVKANEHTFHFTNCSPQHKNFNQKAWLDLEDYLLDNARDHSMKVSVFTGPVFRDDDVRYRDAQIPDQFWKVAVMLKGDAALSATAYLQTQEDLIGGDLEFVYGQFGTYQVPVTQIEELTGLDFGNLRDADPMAAGQAARVQRAEDIRL